MSCIAVYVPAGSGSLLAEALSDSGSAGSDSAAVESGSETTGIGPKGHRGDK